MRKRYLLPALALAAVGIFFTGALAVRANVDDAAVSYLSETMGAVGEEVTIHGNDFGDDCPGKSQTLCALQVFWGDTNVNFMVDAEGNGVSWTDTAITVKVPEDAESGDIRVYRNETFNHGQDDEYQETFDITGPEFTVLDAEDAPTITKVWPTEVVVGDTVTIYGHDLEDACEGESTLTCTAQV